MKQWLFDQIHQRNLIDNQCWEDPTVDKQALSIFARLLNWHIDRRQGLRQDLDLLQAMNNIPEQAEFYRTRIAPRLWTPGLRWILRRQITMSLLGVPADQVTQIHNTADSNLSDFIQDRVDRVFTQVLLANNYFWRVYINGRYTLP